MTRAPARREPRFQKGQIVHWGDNPYMQVLKIRWDEDGSPIYKVRYYNSLALFTGYWARERDLRPM